MLSGKSDIIYLKIVGFKCHIDSTFEIDKNSMILLKGPSGVGKSTILQAIYWALYEGQRGVYNNSGVIKTCSVTLKINQLLIFRQKRPELLKVTIYDKDEKTYEDTVAQQIINQAFGSKELWKSCSFIGQKERCELLSGSAAERLTLLNQLSFNMDDPKEYINRIDHELKTVNQQFLESQTIYTTEVNIFSQEISKRTIVRPYGPEEIVNLKNKIETLEKEVTKLYENVLSHERSVGSYNMIMGQIKSYENQLNLLGQNNYDENQYNIKVQTLNNTINDLKQIISKVKDYNTVQTKLELLKRKHEAKKTQIYTTTQEIKNIKIESNVNNSIFVDSQLIWQTTNQETNRAKYMKAARDLQCEYKQDVISNTIHQLQDDIKQEQLYQHKIKIYNQWKEMDQRLNSLGLDNTIFEQPNLLNNLQNNINNLALEISELKKGLELLACPKCAASLRYINNKLIPGERDLVNPLEIKEKENEYVNTINYINKIRTGEQIKGQLNAIANQLKEYNFIQQVHINITEYQRRITLLSQIQIIPEPPHSSVYLQTIYDYNNAMQKKQQLENTLKTLDVELIEIEKEINSIVLPENSGINSGINAQDISNYEKELTQLHQSNRDNLNRIATIRQLTTTIDQLKSQSISLEKLLNPNVKSIYNTTQQMLKDAKKELDDAIYSNSMREKQKELEVKRDKLMSVNQDLVALGRLKQHAVNIECKQLQDTVDNINLALVDILPLFFTDPIDMKLQLYKTLKTKKQVKPGLNVYIKYKGVEYDNINILSGGEGDRISLALVIALNQVSNSPVLLLDECISSLDGNLKESCISAMKQITGKTIICVDHEGVEGYYDKTITVR